MKPSERERAADVGEDIDRHTGIERQAGLEIVAVGGFVGVARLVLDVYKRQPYR